MAVKNDTEQIPDFALVPVGVLVDRRRGRQMRVLALQRDLQADIRAAAARHVALDRQQLVDNREIGRRQVATILAQTLVDRGKEYGKAWCRDRVCQYA